MPNAMQLVRTVRSLLVLLLAPFCAVMGVWVGVTEGDWRPIVVGALLGVGTLIIWTFVVRGVIRVRRGAEEEPDT